MVKTRIKLKELNQQQRKVLTQPISFALMATALSSCGGGEGTNFNYNIYGSSSKGTSSLQTFDVSTFGLTNDVSIDSMLGGSKWNFPDNAIIRYAISDSPNNIKFDNNSFPIVKDITDKAFSKISDYTGLNFAYAGRYNSPQEAYLDGIDFSISLDGSDYGQQFSNEFSSSAAALAYYPDVKLINGNEPNSSGGMSYAQLAGDVFTNYDSYTLLESYYAGTEGGSLFRYIIIHELGHAFGLKHPFDNGNYGQPTFNQAYGISNNLDNDVHSVMSYTTDFGGDINLVKYDPETYMILDVLALQYLYGKNTQHNSGNNIHHIINDGAYSTIWDPSGIDTISLENSTHDWFVSLPWYRHSTLNSELIGYCVTYTNSIASYPTDIAWFLGEIENISSGSGNDILLGNFLPNFISGGEGDDELEGWEGNDVLVGGSGKDTFFFAQGWGIDVIQDFNSKEDTIILMDSDFVTLNQNTIVTELDSQGNLTYVLDEYSKLILYGINLADMSTNYLGDKTLGSQLDNNKENQENQNIQENISNEVESNNSFSTADVISSGTTISGNLHSSSDIDIFKIYNSGTSTLTLHFDAPTNSIYDYFNIFIRDLSGNVISQQATGLDKTFSTWLGSEGSYYIQIEDSSYYNASNYLLTTSISTTQNKIATFTEEDSFNSPHDYDWAILNTVEGKITLHIEDYYYFDLACSDILSGSIRQQYSIKFDNIATESPSYPNNSVSDFNWIDSDNMYTFDQSGVSKQIQILHDGIKNINLNTDDLYIGFYVMTDNVWVGEDFLISDAVIV